MELTIEKVISKSIESIKSNFSFFIALILVFFVASGILEFLFWQLETKNFLLVMILSLLDLALYTKFAVIIHRTVILNLRNEVKSFLSWGPNDTKFFFLSLGLYLLLFVSLFVVNFVFAWFIFSPDTADAIQTNLLIVNSLFLIFIGIIFSRICLVFPAIAVNQNMGISDSFELTKKNGFKMFILIVLLPIVTNILISKFYSEDSLTIDILVNLILLLAIVFGITLLSNTYTTLTAKLDEDGKISEHKA